MRSRLVWFGVLVGLLYCGTQTAYIASADTIDAVGFVRFAHTAIDVGPIDIYRSDSTTTLVKDLAYGSYSNYLTLPASTVGYVARMAGSAPDSPVLFKLDWGVKANDSDMIIACGLNLQKAFILEPLTVIRNTTRGKARLRIFNTVWGGAALTVRTGQGTVLGQGLTYLKLADQDVEPGTYDFEVTNSNNQSLALRSGITIEADKIYVLLIIGGKDRQPPLDLMVIANDQETTRVKIINKSGKSADIYMKGAEGFFASGLSSDQETAFARLPSGATTFIMRDAGSSANSSVISSIATQLRPGHDITITITTTNRSILMGITADVLSPDVLNALQNIQPSLGVTPVPPTNQ